MVTETENEKTVTQASIIITCVICFMNIILINSCTTDYKKDSFSNQGIHVYNLMNNFLCMPSVSLLHSSFLSKEAASATRG
jgi:hypothetical protein